jgi:hypothetical protein
MIYVLLPLTLALLAGLLEFHSMSSFPPAQMKSKSFSLSALNRTEKVYISRKFFVKTKGNVGKAKVTNCKFTT